MPFSCFHGTSFVIKVVLDLIRLAATDLGSPDILRVNAFETLIRCEETLRHQDFESLGH